MDFGRYTNKEAKDILKEFSVASESGLSPDKAEALLSKYGPNQIKGREVTWLTILARQFKSPFLYLLIGAAFISLLLKETADGLLIFAFVTVNAVLGFYQEFRSHQALRLLEKFVASKTKVLRDNKVELIDSFNLVPGDIVLLSPGDTIRADMRFIQANNLLIDESVLTGETATIEKTSAKLKTQSEIYKAKNIGFSGTTVVRGEAKGIVIATGMDTAIGKIAGLTTQTVSLSSFEKNIAKISQFVLRLVLITLTLVFLANFLLKGKTVDVIELIIFTIALAVSVIPEALPVVTTFSLSKGAVKLAKNKVVVKRLSAIEDLGGIQVLCTDKTGTLTENHLKLCAVNAENKNEAITFALLVPGNGGHSELNDPFDLALWESLKTEERRQLSAYQRLSDMPFDPFRRRNSVIVRKDKKTYLLARGAPEEIFKICQKDSINSDLFFWVKRQGSQGNRILALAKKNLPSRQSYNIIKEETDLELMGLFAFEDPLKKTAREAINKAKVLGVSIKILTGDAREVAGNVAKNIGLIKNPAKVISGEEFDSLPDSLKIKALEDYSVFARVSPEQKYKIVKALKEKYEVGFLGEGINDAPALKIANVALVVQGAADIAKDAADIVILQKSLEVIIDGISEGRKVFSNTTKYIKSTLASNFGNFFAVASASLLIPFLPLLPLQILLLNLLSDFPMISVATDTVDEEELSSPKSYRIQEIASVAIILGLVSTFFDFIFFSLFYRISPSVLQTNWFIGSVLTELALVFSIRSKKPFFKAKPASITIIFLTIITVFFTLSLPLTFLGRKLFDFTRPTFYNLLIIIGLVTVYFAVTETVKLLYFRVSERTRLNSRNS